MNRLETERRADLVEAYAIVAPVAAERVRGYITLVFAHSMAARERLW